MAFSPLDNPFIAKILTLCGIVTFMVALMFSVEQSRYNERGVSTHATISDIVKGLKFNEIQYQFIVQEKTITGDDRSGNGFFFSPKRQIGDSINIEYLHDRPATNRIKKSFNHAWLYVMSLLMLFFGMRRTEA